MSIVPVKKISLFGLKEHKRRILQDVQKMGVVHVVHMQGNEKKREEKPEDYIEALKHLERAPHKHPMRALESGFDPDAVVNQVLDNKYTSKRLADEKDRMKKYIDAIEGWGDFELPEPEDIGGRSLFFYEMPHAKKKQLAKAYKKSRKKRKIPNLTWQEVGQSSRTSYIVVITEGEEPQGVPGERVEFGELTLGQAKHKYEELAIALEDLADERKKLTQWIGLLHNHLAEEEDQTTLAYVSGRAFDNGDFFALQGWIAERDEEAVRQFANDNDLALLIEEPTSEDDPPTLLNNAPLSAPGEELVKFYQMPSYQMWDPSAVIYFSFAIFFAMIMSDFGYGVVLGLITLITWRKMGKSAVGKRVRSMFAMISGLCMVYGVLVGSYFGFESPVAVLKDFQIVDVNDFDSMIRLSVGIGVLHIILANFIRAVHAYPRWNMLSYVGWMIMMGSGYAMYMISHEIFEIQAAMATGIAMVFLFSSTRPLKGWKNIILRPIDGLLGLTNISKAFGDALSYIRLFALGLSSALLASTFNDLAAQSWEKPGVGILIGIVVLVLGHVLNLVLAIMGGLVHGLRLNFIEFTNWGLSGEGYAFQPFALKEKKQWNK